MTTVASGRTCARSAVSVSRAAPGSWPLQMSTGSSTTCSHVRERSDSATTSIVAGVPSMPIFTTDGSCVTVAASNWSAITCGSTGTKR